MKKNVPFTGISEKSVGALGEIKLIERAKKIFAFASPPAPRGMGDDCAVLPAFPQDAFSPETKRLITTDSVIFAKHFDESVSPEDAGKKLIRRNVSDIAAMGGVPADAVLSLIMSDDVSAAWLERFLQGVADECVASRDKGWSVELSGGDIASAPAKHFFSATLALTGFSENPLLRTGAREGDFLYVTGTLGGSISEKHFNFRPRVAEGRFLANLPKGIVRSCIDVTDGLLKDHAALLPAGTHAEFDFDAIPVSAAARALGGDLIQRAFCDGEDYELLFAVEGTQTVFFEKCWREKFPEIRISRIAKIVSGAENPELSARLAGSRAYEHFRR